MCLACLDYLDNKLTMNEYLRNRSELVKTDDTVEHPTESDIKHIKELNEKQELSRVQWYLP